MLGALAEPLDGTRQRLLDLGVVEVPEADWARFIVTHLPGLRRKARVRAASGDLDLPEAVPPRLALRATFEPGHRAHLEWGFRYGAAGGGVLVPMTAEEPDPMRDRAAERDLVEGLLDVDEVAGFDPLWQVVARVRRLVPETRLHGFRTVAFAELLPVLDELPSVELTVVGEPATYSEAVDAPLIQVSTSDPADGAPTDWFDLGISVTVAGEDVPLAPLIEAIARGHEHLILDSGTWFSLDRPELETLRALVDEARSLQDKPTDPLRISVVHAGLWEELRRPRRRRAAVASGGAAPWGRCSTSTRSSRPSCPPASTRRCGPTRSTASAGCRCSGTAGSAACSPTTWAWARPCRCSRWCCGPHERGELDDPVLVVAPTSVLSTWAERGGAVRPVAAHGGRRPHPQQGRARARGDHRRRAGRHHLVRRARASTRWRSGRGRGARSCSTRRSS